MRGPTRKEYLLDLVLSNLEGVKCKVEAEVADHKLVVTELKLDLPEEETVERRVWSFHKADWGALSSELAGVNWDSLTTKGADEAAELVTKSIFDALKKHMPPRLLKERKSTHPWLTQEVLELVKKKRDAEGNRRRLKQPKSAAKLC